MAENGDAFVGYSGIFRYIFKVKKWITLREKLYYEIV